MAARVVCRQQSNSSSRHQNFTRAVFRGGTLRDAIWFGHIDPLPPRVTLAYRLSVDEYNGRQRLQMIVEAAQPSAERSVSFPSP